MVYADWGKLTGAKTFAELVTNMMARLKEAGTRVTNLNIGGAARTLFLELPSQGLADLHDMLKHVVKQGFVMYASGVWLDLNADNVGLVRKSEQKASGVVMFKRNPEVSGNIRIPKGVIVKTPTGPDGRELRFFSTEDVILLAKDDEVAVPVSAEEAGSAYSVGAGYITELVSSVNGIIGISNKEDWLVQEGTDTESDDDLRVRCILRWHELSQGSTKYAYQSWALSVEGVREAYILDQHPRGQGTVDVILVGTGGTPSETIINEVQKLIDSKRPVCSDVLVRAPTQRFVNVDVEVFIHPTDGDEETVKAACERVIDALFVEDKETGIRPFGIGEDVTTARLIHALMGVEHVYNVDIYAPNDDVSVEVDELAVKTNVRVIVQRLEEL